MYRIKEGFYIGTGREMKKIAHKMRKHGVFYLAPSGVFDQDVVTIHSGTGDAWLVVGGLQAVNSAFLYAPSKEHRCVINMMARLEYHDRGWNDRVGNVLYPVTLMGLEHLDKIPPTKLHKWLEFKRKGGR